MHAESMELMAKHLSRVDLSGKNVLDVGSYDVNGSYRELVEGRGGLYTGLDVRAGKNVDVVADNPYCYPFDSDTFDVVMCGNSLHNVSHPWILVPELARILGPGGLLVIVTIWEWGLNSYPQDFFRFTDSGLFVLFNETYCLGYYQLEMADNKNVAGSAVKLHD